MCNGGQRGGGAMALVLPDFSRLSLSTEGQADYLRARDAYERRAAERDVDHQQDMANQDRALQDAVDTEERKRQAALTHLSTHPGQPYTIPSGNNAGKMFYTAKEVNEFFDRKIYQMQGMHQARMEKVRHRWNNEKNARRADAERVAWQRWMDERNGLKINDLDRLRWDPDQVNYVAYRRGGAGKGVWKPPDFRTDDEVKAERAQRDAESRAKHWAKRGQKIEDYAYPERAAQRYEGMAMRRDPGVPIPLTKEERDARHDAQLQAMREAEAHWDKMSPRERARASVELEQELRNRRAAEDAEMRGGDAPPRADYYRPQGAYGGGHFVPGAGRYQQPM